MSPASPEFQLNTHPVAFLAMLSALPIIGFAIWADSAERNWKDREEEEIRASVGLATLFALACQLFLFFASKPIRNDHPGWALLVFLGALMVQSRQQQKLLERLVPSEAAPLPQNLRIQAQQRKNFRAFGLFSLVLGAVSLCPVFGGLIGLGLGTAIKAQGEPLLLMAVLGAFVGVLVAIALVFAVAPFMLKQSLSGERLPEGELRAKVERRMQQISLPAPEIWKIARPAGSTLGSGSSHEGWAAFIAGLPFFFKSRKLNALFRPTLFLGEDLLSALSEPELDAVLCHEAAHLARRHIIKRLVASTAMIIGFTLAGASALVGARMLLPPLMADALNILLPFIGLLLPITVVRTQIQAHELEADRYAVMHLGADPEALISALRKLEVKDKEKILESNLRLGTHPPTAERLGQLKVLAVLGKQRPHPQGDEVKENKAA